MGRGLQVRLLAAAPDSGGCLDANSKPPESSALFSQSGTLRLSVVRRASDGSEVFLCDATAQVPTGTPNLDIGSPEPGTYRVHAEFFDSSGARAATGAAQLSTERTGDPLPLLLSGTARWSCPPAILAAPRAFHAITPLPSGELLITGGITALSERTPDLFQVVNKVEVYDPARGTLRLLSEDRGIVPRGRAFHQAAVLDQTSSGRVRVLLFGGIADSIGRETVRALGLNKEDVFSFSSSDGAHSGGAEIIELDLQAGRVLRPNQAAAQPYGSVAFAGGTTLPKGGLLTLGGYGDALNPVTDALLTLPPASGKDPAPLRVAVGAWLIAPSVTLLSGGEVLALAASHSGSGTPAAGRMAALRLGGLSGGALQVLRSDEVEGPATAAHGSLLLRPKADDQSGVQQILVSGGFFYNTDKLHRQAPAAADALRVYKLPTGGAAPVLSKLTPYDKGLDGRAYRGAGFEAATLLSSGRRALITGGSPGNDALCDADDQAQPRLLCVLRQASLFDADQERLSPAPPLSLARMGHAQVLLPDGTVLLLGGLTRPGGVATGTAELTSYNARSSTGPDPEDPIAPLLAKQGLSRGATSEARPCTLIK